MKSLFGVPDFCTFLPKPTKGSNLTFFNLHTCKSLIFLALIGVWASKFAFDGYGKSAKRIHESRVMSLSIRKSNNLAKTRSVMTLTNI